SRSTVARWSAFLETISRSTRAGATASAYWALHRTADAWNCSTSIANSASRHMAVHPVAALLLRPLRGPPHGLGDGQLKAAPRARGRLRARRPHLLPGQMLRAEAALILAEADDRHAGRQRVVQENRHHAMRQ